MTHGGMGYAKEYHVERYLREVLIPRIAPVSPQMILELHRRARARPAEILLRSTETPPSLDSFSAQPREGGDPDIFGVAL